MTLRSKMSLVHGKISPSTSVAGGHWGGLEFLKLKVRVTSLLLWALFTSGDNIYIAVSSTPQLKMLNSSLNPILLLVGLILPIADNLSGAQGGFHQIISKPYAKLSMLAPTADARLRAYSLTSVMLIILERDRLRFDLQEWHSLEQRRSKVKYRRISAQRAPAWWRDARLPDEGIVHSDNRGRQLMVTPGVSCLELNGDLASMMFELQALKNTKTQDTQPHLIGPTRLLQVLALNLHNVKQIAVSEVTKAQPAFAPLRPIETKLQFKLELDDNLSLWAFYSGQPGQNLDLGVPLELHLRKSNEFVLVYQFERVEMYPAGSSSSNPVYCSNMDSMARQFSWSPPSAARNNSATQTT